MIEGFENSTHIKNKNGILIPVQMIKVTQSVYEAVTEQMKSERISLNNYQEFFDRVFRYYEDTLQTDHEMNLCKTEKEVIEIYQKNLYYSVKNMVHGQSVIRCTIDLVDGVSAHKYIGCVIDPIKSIVKIYKVNPPSLHVDKIEISIGQFYKIKSKIEELIS